jgi:hypothetical protein
MRWESELVGVSWLMSTAEEIPEARKTLQRVLANLDALAASPDLPAGPPPELDNGPPLSPLALDTPNVFFVPSIRQAGTVVIPTPPYVPSDPSSVRLFASSTRLLRQNVSLPTLSSNTSSPDSLKDGPRRQSGQAAENIRTYVQKALDVLSRHNAPHDFDVPDVSGSFLRRARLLSDDSGPSAPSRSPTTHAFRKCHDRSP